MQATQSDLDTLNAALLSGAKEVKIGDRLISFRTQAELIALIAIVSASLTPAPPVVVSSSIIPASFSKGYGQRNDT